MFERDCRRRSQALISKQSRSDDSSAILSAARPVFNGYPATEWQRLTASIVKQRIVKPPPSSPREEYKNTAPVVDSPA
jgi:hypothetical protein